MERESISFENHIAKIKFARARTEEIFAEFEMPTEAAMASLSRAWEMLFDSICANGDGSIGELKDIASVIQRLSSSSQKIQEIELKRSAKIKSMALDDECHRLRVLREELQNGRLPCDIVKTVEEQLRLL
jgi:uncharacterized protein YhaN